MWYLRYGTSEPIYKTETDSQTQRTDLWLPKGRRMWRGMYWGLGVGRCKLMHLSWINNKTLMDSTENYIQYPVLREKNIEKNIKNNYIYV